MKTICLEDVNTHDLVFDAYSTCKFLERQGIQIDEVTLGNVHDEIEEAVDNNNLPITQVVYEQSYPTNNGIHSWTSIEGYIIGA